MKVINGRQPLLLMLFALFFSPAFCQQEEPVAITVSGKFLKYNGEGRVPVGLFGVHTGNFQGFNANLVQKWGIESARTIQVVPSGNTYNPPAGINQVVDCWYDRFQPAVNVERPLTWKTQMLQRAHQYANNLNGLNREVIFEFWNEPYLNWAYKPGVNTDPQFYDTIGRQLNGPVFLKGKTEPEPFLKWKIAQWYSSPHWAANRQGIYNAVSNAWNNMLSVRNIPYPGLTGALLPGETYFPGTNREFTVIETLRPVDTTQHSFYSAKQGSLHYNEMYGLVADTLRKLKPDLMLAAGWGFEFQDDNWTPWKNLVKPLIDEHAPLIDAIHEHHYGMDTRIMAAGYETIYSYTQKTHGRNLKFINTETGGFLDPQRPNQPGNPPGTTAKQRALNAFIYNTKDIGYMLAHCPDKAYARAIHEPQNTGGGAGMALRHMKSLRGQLMHTNSNNSDVWPVATLSADSLLTVFCFNNKSIPNALQISISAPQGLNFTGARLQQVDTLPSADTLAMVEVNLPANGQLFEQNLTLAPFQSAVWKLRLAGGVNTTDTTNILQFFADSILTNVSLGQTKTVPINIPANQLAGGAHARLKFVMQNGKGTIKLNGQTLAFKYQGDTARRNRGGISYASVPVSLLTASNQLELTADNEAFDLWMASVELSTESLITQINQPEIKKTDVTMFPNPATDAVFIRLPAGAEKGLVQIFDLHGKIVLTNSLERNQQSISITGLLPGLYLTKIIWDPGYTANLKLFKK